MNGTPPISCMCLTFARPKIVLEEAIYSFLQQDYKGPKELIVLNDFEQQTIKFDHPEVKIINIPKRFKTVGEKRNACAALSTYNMLAVWDDDDIYLPHRLSFSVQMYDEKKRYFKPSKAWMMSDGILTGPKSNLYHSSGIWHRSLFDEVGGYAHMGSGQDMEIELKYEKLIPHKNYNNIKNEEIFYIYRWGGTGSYHLSGFGTDKANQKTGNDKVMDYALERLQAGKIASGEIMLNPSWKLDYPTLVKQYINSL